MTNAERWMAHMRGEAHWANGQCFVSAGSLWGVGKTLAEAVENAQEREASRWHRAPAVAADDELN